MILQWKMMILQRTNDDSSMENDDSSIENDDSSMENEAILPLDSRCVLLLTGGYTTWSNMPHDKLPPDNGAISSYSFLIDFRLFSADLGLFWVYLCDRFRQESACLLHEPQEHMVLLLEVMNFAFKWLIMYLK